MILNKNKKLNTKYILSLLLQLIVMGFLFVIVFDKELVFFAKDFINNLQIGGEYQSFIYKFLVGCKVLLNSPSLFAFFVFLLQLITFTTTISFLCYFVMKHYYFIYKFIKTEKRKSCVSYEYKKNISLKNIKMLC